MDWIPSEIGKYEVKRRLGGGEFSDVFLVRDTALDADIALKVLKETDPDLLLPQLEEAKNLYKCRNKHIVHVNGASIQNVGGNRKVVIDMEYVQGGSLEDRMKDNFVTAHEALKHIRDILFGLKHAHQYVLHRDIKPGNIMLGNNCSKLSDFGLSTAKGINKVGSRDGYIPHYAPEVFTKNETTILTDIYSVGITFFRIICNINKDSWKLIKRDKKKLTEKIKNGKLIKSVGYSPHVPRQIRRIINKACNLEPDKRFQTADEMRQSIDGLKLNINWRKLDNNSWEGKDQRSSTYEIHLSKRRKYWIEVRKNGKGIGANSTSFEEETSAIEYFYDFLRKTTLS